MRDLVIATKNAGKFLEFSQMMMDLPYTLDSLQNHSIPQAEETACTFIENALIKARHTAQCLNKPCIADDSGLIIEALDGRPGIYSARYGQAGQSNIDRVLEEMADVPKTTRQAYFYCVLVYMRHKEDPTPEIFTGRWSGSILSQPKGGEGFGYDPIFYDPMHQKTAAEMPMPLKNTCSHRAKSLQKLVQFLDQT